MKHNPYKLVEHILLGLMLVAVVTALFFVIHFTDNWRAFFTVVGALGLLVVVLTLLGWWDNKKDAWDKRHRGSK